MTSRAVADLNNFLELPPSSCALPPCRMRANKLNVLVFVVNNCKACTRLASIKASEEVLKHGQDHLKSEVPRVLPVEAKVVCWRGDGGERLLLDRDMKQPMRTLPDQTNEIQGKLISTGTRTPLERLISVRREELGCVELEVGRQPPIKEGFDPRLHRCPVFRHFSSLTRRPAITKTGCRELARSPPVFPDSSTYWFGPQY
jgi:hypothetical protein